VFNSKRRKGPVAQRLEQGTHNPLVPGSNPGGPIFDFGFAIVERVLSRMFLATI
jgi:hypothetical protein